MAKICSKGKSTKSKQNFKTVSNIYGNGGILNDIKPYLDQFNEYIVQAAQAHNGLVVPLYATMNGPNGDQNPLEYIQNDQCHLNVNGHQTVADMLRKLGYEK